MAKFRVTVCLPPAASTDIVAALTAALAPFDMNLDVPEASDGWNEQGRWDSWRVSAGHDQRLLVKAEHVGDPRLVYAGIELGGRPPSPPPPQCDGGPKGLLDFAGTRDRAVAMARTAWEAQYADWRRAVADHPPAQPWAWFQARHEADPARHPVEQARIDHRNQPLNKALAHVSVSSRYPRLGIWTLGSDPIAHFARGGRHLLDAAAASAVATWALLTTDGTWIDGDQDGLLSAPDLATLQGMGLAHLRRIAAHLDALDDDVVLVQVLCHC